MDDEDFDDYTTASVRTFGNWSPDYLNDIDTSEWPFPNRLWHIKPQAEIAVKTTATLIIGVGGLYLNSVILLVLIKNKWLWSPTNYLIGNLALVDFVILLTCPWFMLVRDFYQAYVLGYVGCKFEGYLQASLLVANVGAVMLVSYDRLAAAALAVEARVTKSVAPKLIFLSWAVAFLMALPWIFKSTYTVRLWLNYVEKFCWEDRSMLILYWHFVLAVLVWIPLGVMLITYSTIMWRLEKTAKKLRSRGGGQAVSKAKTKALKVTACVLIADVICRIPYSIMVYWRYNNDMTINSVDGPYEVIWFLAQYLMYANCAINPLIYGFTNTRFRKAMDRTPGVACCRFGSWCCACAMFKKKQVHIDDKNTEKIFVIETTPKPSLKLNKIIKKVLHINTDTIDLSIYKVDEGNSKPTKVTPLKVDNI